MMLTDPYSSAAIPPCIVCLCLRNVWVIVVDKRISVGITAVRYVNIYYLRPILTFAMPDFMPFRPTLRLCFNLRLCYDLSLID